MSVATKTQPTKFDLDLLRKIQARAMAMVLYGQAGIGKSAFAGAIDGCAFLIDDQEDGIHTLKQSGLAPQSVLVFPAATTWEEALAIVRAAETIDDCSTLVVDTIGGMERLCAEHVCQTQFRGNWGEKGFAGFGRGWEACLPEWRQFLSLMDRVRGAGKSVVLLAHSTIKAFKNPEGSDYDQYQVDCHRKIWSATSKWVDMVLFANTYTAIEEDGLRVKAKGGTARYLYPQGCAAYEAKNRYGLTEPVPMGRSGTEAWANLCQAIKSQKEKNHA